MGNYTYTDPTNQTTTGKLIVNMCNAVAAPTTCNSTDPSLVLFVSDDEKTCVSLLSSKIEDNDYVVLDNANPLNGFKIQKKGSTIEADIKCNSNAPMPLFNIVGQNIEVQSQDSCGEYNGAARIFVTHKYILTIIFIVIGLVLLTVGGYKWDAILGTIGFFVGFGFMFFIFWSEVTFKDETTSYLIIIGISLVVGVLCAYLCTTFVFLSYILMGFAGGFFFSKYLLASFQFSGEKVS